MVLYVWDQEVEKKSRSAEPLCKKVQSFTNGNKIRKIQNNEEALMFFS